MSTLLTVFLFLLLWSSNVRGDASCPDGCECDNSSITCTDLNRTEFDQILSGLNNDLISRFTVRKCSSPLGRIEAFPSNFHTRSLEISSCGVSGFGSNAFDSLTNDLVELRLANNSLTSVPFLQKLSKLEMLNLNRNSLDTIPEGSFNGLEKLAQLRLKNNKICKLPSKALNEVKGSLELLDLGYNCLSSVPAPNLRSAIFLRHLDLSGNRITTIKDLELMNLPDLKEIRLSDNRIKDISLRAFVNVPTLTHLYIKQNELVQVDPIMLQGFKFLNVIDLSGNQLQKIPSFKDMAELKNIYLHDNNITRIDTLTFNNNPKLQMIGLQNNEISLIARNSFDSLNALTHLLLSNNSLQSIEPGVFDGMPKLVVLGLRNNSITDLTTSSFASLAQLGSIDLANNHVHKIMAGTFVAQKKLYWLDLSDNQLESLEKGAFAGPVATILLHGNNLVCDTSLDWFITYLVQYNVRTFLPRQPEITCASPQQFAGVRIKELMIKKANDTLNSSMQQLGIANTPQQRNNFLSNLLPALSGMGLSGGGNAGAGGTAPVLGTLSQAIPSLRSLPGMNGILPGTNPGDPSTKNLESAVEQFAEPLVRFSSGAQPAASDVSSLIKSIPNLVVNLPGYGNIDISKVNPKLIEHVLSGGQIPGVPKETLDEAVKQIMTRVYAAAAIETKHPLEQEISRTLPRNFDPKKYLRPLSDLPQSFVTNVIDGKPMPHLTAAQTEVVKRYYAQNIPPEFLGNVNIDDMTAAGGGVSNMSSFINPQMVQMLQMLPPGYNMSKLPKEVIQAAMRGEMPDITQLPEDLQRHIQENIDKFAKFAGANNPSIEEILKKLPKFKQSEHTNTFTPYDINTVDSDLVVKENQSNHDMRMYIAIALGVISVATLLILIGFCVYVRRNKVMKYSEPDF